MFSLLDAQTFQASYEIKAHVREMEKASRQSAQLAEALKTSGSDQAVTRTQFFVMFWVRRVFFRLAPSVAYRFAI